MISDVLVIGIFLISIIAGYRRGFVRAIFRIFSKVISLVMAVKFYDPVTGIIRGSILFSKLSGKIHEKIGNIIADSSVVQGDVAGNILTKMDVPNPIKVSVLSELPYNINTMDTTNIVDIVSTKIEAAVLRVLGMIAVFIIVRLVLFLLRVILDKVFHLPILNQMNKILGLVFGAIEGFIVVYIAMSVVIILNNNAILASIDRSLIAWYFYYNNVLLAMMR